MSASSPTPFTPLPVPASLLGESPFWHPQEQALYWIDIPGRAIQRFDPLSLDHQRWPLPDAGEPGSIAPLQSGGLLLAARDGFWRFDTRSGERELLLKPPYDPAGQRWNDGKADPQGRFWVGSLDDKRAPNAALYRFDGDRLERMVPDAAVSNGLAWSPDGRTMYWSDTKAHRIEAFDFDGSDGSLSRRRVFKQFPLKPAEGPLDAYGGRPDGAAMDSEGHLWVSMFEGQRLLKLAPDGTELASIPLPVRCATMPCFGGADLKTLFVTTARENRPADELAAQPWAGRVLQMRVDVPGLPVNVVAL